MVYLFLTGIGNIAGKSPDLSQFVQKLDTIAPQYQAVDSKIQF